jgi:tRNA pseudouridine55 synthase
MRPNIQFNGFLVIDKPAGITSRDAVDAVQAWFPKHKLGHAGTLDPAATGVLVMGVGPAATRLIEYVQDQEKVYLTTFRLGGTSTTDDAEGEITPKSNVSPPDEEKLKATLKQFTGTNSQTPPAFSAARVQGERAHTKARRGENVILQPRQVTVHEIRWLSYKYPDLELEIRCSKGTYIRSIARDFGEAVGMGGYVQQLRRTRIGNISCEQAVPLTASAEDAQRALLPMEVAGTHLPRCDVSDDVGLRLQQGQPIKGPREYLPSGDVTLWMGERFLGMGHYDSQHQVLKAAKMVLVD